MMTYTETISLTKIDCGSCGGTYAVNERYRADRARDGGGWTCPYCKCSWGYSQDNENLRLKRELEQKARELTAAKCDTLREKQLREAAEVREAKSNRKLRRVHNGVCPCCKRTFSNLARHMATKHPTVEKP